VALLTSLSTLTLPLASLLTTAVSLNFRRPSRSTERSEASASLA
jgi:hypothetical protein